MTMRDLMGKVAVFSFDLKYHLAAPPNLLYLMTDQNSAMAMWNNGDSFSKTPNIARLAQRGSYFTKATVPSTFVPWCSLREESMYSSIFLNHLTHELSSFALCILLIESFSLVPVNVVPESVNRCFSATCPFASHLARLCSRE